MISQPFDKSVDKPRFRAFSPTQPSCRPNSTRSRARRGLRWMLAWSGCALLLLVALSTGCRSTVMLEKPAKSEPDPFEGEKVARLADKAFKVAWDAKYFARLDLNLPSFQPTALDWEALDYLERICHKVPWISRDIKKHPESPRTSSQRSYDIVRYDLKIFKLRYQPSSFRRATDIKIQKLLRILDEITDCYDQPPSKTTPPPSPPSS